jgi:hypothetical protein
VRSRFVTDPRIMSLSLLFAWAMSACTTTTIVEPYYRPATAQIDQAYMSPNADFSVYSKLMASPLEIYYPDNAPAPSDQDLERLRSIFREAFLTEIGDDYPIVSAPGPDVMHVVAQIIDLKIAGPLGTYEPSGRLREVVAKGQLTLLMEFRDSTTGRVLARAGDTERGESTSLTQDDSSWDEVTVAARRWAALFKQFLDQNLGRANGS